MKKEKFLTVAVVILIILNLGIIAFLVVSRPPHPPELWKMVVHELELDDAQQEQYFTLRESHRKGMMHLDDEFAGVLRQYMDLLQSPPDSVKEAELSGILAELEKKKAEHILDHFRKVKALCREEQLKKFDALVPRLIPVLLPPKDPRPHPGGPRR